MPCTVCGKGLNFFCAQIFSPQTHNSMCKPFALPVCFFVVAVACGLLLSPANDAVAQITQESANFTYFNRDHGLAHLRVNALLQDRKGFIWIATEDGLNRFDSNYFSHCGKLATDKVPSFKSNVFYCLTEDSKGRIWAGTSREIACYDPTTDRFRVYNDSTTRFYGAHTILENANGQLLLASGVDGIIVFHPLDGTFHKTALPVAEGKFIHEMAWGPGGNLWVSTHGEGISIFTPELELVQTINKQGSGLVSDSVSAFHCSPGKAMWIGTHHQGLQHYDAATGQFTTFNAANSGLLSDEINTITEDPSGRLWVGTKSGLASALPGNKRFVSLTSRWGKKKGASSTNAVLSLIADRAGGIWSGYYNGGLSYLDVFNSQVRRYSEESGLSLSHVLSFAEGPDNRLWIGTDGGGINAMENGEIVSLTKKPASPTKLKALKNGNVLAGAYASGLYVFANGEVFNYRHTDGCQNCLNNNTVWAIFEDSKGQIWIGTDGLGVQLFDPETGSFQTFGAGLLNTQGNNAVKYLRVVCEDVHGGIWVGGFSNLVRFAPGPAAGSYTPQVFDHARLGGQYVVSAHTDSKNRMWLGTYGGGLLRFDYEDSTFKAFTTTDGLSNNMVYSIEEDRQGNLWLATNRGVSKFNPDALSFKNHGKGSGFQGSSFTLNASHKDQHGNLYFGGPDGFSAFHPDSLLTDTIPPPVVLSHLLLFNKHVQTGAEGSPLHKHISELDTLVLEHWQNVVGIGFSALGFSNASQKTYAYKLENFDKDWNYSNMVRVATYTNLDPGRYVFRAKAANSNGYWNETGARLFIVVKPPWWRTIWAKGAALIVCGLLAWSLHTYRIRFLTDQKRKLEDRIKKRTFELQEKNEEIVAQAEEIKEAHEALSATNETLEHLVAERTATLDSTNRKLKATNQELELFLYRSSHDFRGPLTTLFGLKNLAGLITDDPQVNDLFAKVDLTARGMDQMLQKLVMLYDTLTDEEPPSRFLLYPLVEETKAHFAKRLINNKVSFHNRVPVDLTVCAKPGLLRHILVNLVENSLVFSRQNRQEAMFVEISASKTQGSVTVTVKDNGSGIENAAVPKVFDMYYRGSSQSNGNGLGLYVVKKAAERLKGEISIATRLMEGTAVHLRLHDALEPTGDTKTAQPPA